MNILVDIKNYTPFTYDTYFDSKSYKAVPRPHDAKHELGQVVVVKRNESDDENAAPTFHLAVVLGVIDYWGGEVRLDLCGMTSMDDIRPATKEDVENMAIEAPIKLRAECRGQKVSYNWKTYELKIDGKVVKK